MTDVYLIDPAAAAAWAPFCDSRPVSELRAGVWLIRERWEAVTGGETRAVFGAPWLQSFAEDGVPPVQSTSTIDGPALVGRSDFAPSGVELDLPEQPTRLINDDVTVGWWVPEGTQWEDGKGGDWEEVEIDGILLHGAYDLLTALDHFLIADVADFVHGQGDGVPDDCVVLGDPEDVVLLGARVEPGVLFDVRSGAVVVEQHCYVKHGTRFEGPVYVGPGTEILGGSIKSSVFGPRCRVRGEIANAIFLGYANKAHDGFVGHSVIGHWANLGANTVTSNLKNTYGNVRLHVGSEVLDTERMNVGTLMGDHVKTAIGTLFDTGTVVGVGANVFGSVRPPKHVRPFAWGVGGGIEGAIMTREGFVAVAERVMPRRQVDVSEDVNQMLQAIHDHAASL